jgi:tRNA G37 N-methylase Trm5
MLEGLNKPVILTGSQLPIGTLRTDGKENLITAVEINPKGHEYGLINVKLNKLKNVELYCDDVHTFSATKKKKYDRIVMNLSKTAYEFLDDAVTLLKAKGTIHYYDFLHESEFDLAKERVTNAAKKVGRIVKFNGIHTVGSQGIKTYRICVDCVVD